MTIATSREVDLHPVLSFQMLQEPRDGFGIDSGHISRALSNSGWVITLAAFQRNGVNFGFLNSLWKFASRCLRQ